MKKNISEKTKQKNYTLGLTLAVFCIALFALAVIKLVPAP
jgi:hypothetical protein